MSSLSVTVPRSFPSRGGGSDNGFPIPAAIWLSEACLWSLASETQGSAVLNAVSMLQPLQGSCVWDFVPRGRRAWVASRLHTTSQTHWQTRGLLQICLSGALISHNNKPAKNKNQCILTALNHLAYFLFIYFYYSALVYGGTRN